jgi:hypothetical protein
MYRRLLLKCLQISGELKWRLVRTLRHLKSRVKYIVFCVRYGCAESVKQSDKVPNFYSEVLRSNLSYQT